MRTRLCTHVLRFVCYIEDSYIEEMHVSRSTHRASFIVHRASCIVHRIVDSWNHKRVVRLDSGFEWRVLERTGIVLRVADVIVTGCRQGVRRSLLSAVVDRVQEAECSHTMTRGTLGYIRDHSHGIPWHVGSDNGNLVFHKPINTISGNAQFAL